MYIIMESLIGTVSIVMNRKRVIANDCQNSQTGLFLKRRVISPLRSTNLFAEFVLRHSHLGFHSAES